MQLRSILRENGLDVTEGEVFDTFLVSGIDATAIHKAAHGLDINLRSVDAKSVGISLDETVTLKDLSDLASIFGAQKLTAPASTKIAGERTSEYLRHELFNSRHSETSMLRYIRALADRDLALDRTMIPLGSCTMKLNATTEMIPITWPEFSSLHPFAPVDQSKGIRTLIDQLSSWLLEITGYDAVSLQPNAGSQGEFAGLLAIRNFLDAKGDEARDI